MAGERDVPLDDLLATLTELTAILVARSCREYGAQQLFVACGGIRNPTLMRRIRARLPRQPACASSTTLGCQPRAKRPTPWPS
jgi:anhydro-N-acetylmuramic acid kinase